MAKKMKVSVVCLKSLYLRACAATLVLAAPIFFGACSFRNDGRFSVLSGVIAWSRRDWALSASSFLDSAARAKSQGSEHVEEYAVYGLASTWLAQDEYDPALARLASIKDSASGEIRASVWYQAGVIAYRRGEFDEAAACFKRSLQNDPSAVDAKINLELSHRSLEEAEARSSGSSSGFTEDATQNQETEMIFSLVRKKEQDRWKNQEDGTKASSVVDY